MAIMQIDISNLKLGRNKISKPLKKQASKLTRRLTKTAIKNGDADNIENYKQRESTVYNDY